MTKKVATNLQDIARLANVSASTVSRALNNSPLISQQTRERIQAIAREQNFRMNVPARSLRLRQSRTIGFVTPAYTPAFLSQEDVFGQGIVDGVGRGLHALGYDLLMIHGSADDPHWAQTYLDSGRVDGFILMASGNRPEQVQNLVEMEAPFIAWGIPVPGYNYCSVTGDNVNGGQLAARHLLQQGRRRIAFLGGPATEQTVQYRYQGFESALLAAGQRLQRSRVAYGDYTHASGISAMQQLLTAAPDLDAVFVNSDLMAIGAIQALQAQGRRVPQDVAVVGYDDLPIARYNHPPLTTIRQNFPFIGKMLAQNLIQFIQTGTIVHVTTPVELVIRQSA